MAEGLEKLEELKETAKEQSPEEAKKAAEASTTVDTKPQIDDLGRAYATGRRKTSVARVWITKGTGKITVNSDDVDEYFPRPTQRMIIRQPIETADRVGQYDVNCTVSGGGLSGQAGAVRHGLAQALSRYEPDLRSVLKKGGFLTRDARMVERKKYGKRKARRSKQWKKR